MASSFLSTEKLLLPASRCEAVRCLFLSFGFDVISNNIERERKHSTLGQTLQHLLCNNWELASCLVVLVQLIFGLCSGTFKVSNSVAIDFSSQISLL